MAKVACCENVLTNICTKTIVRTSSASEGPTLTIKNPVGRPTSIRVTWSFLVGQASFWGLSSPDASVGRKKIPLDYLPYQS